MCYLERLSCYDEVVEATGFIRKGKIMPYTSHNGHMFSLLNKEGR